jgi:hypothetical protein
MIASVAVDYHVTQVVDGTKGIHGMINGFAGHRISPTLSNFTSLRCDASWHRFSTMSDERRKLPPEARPGDVLVPRPVVAPKAATPGSWTKETRPKSHRPVGALNRITRSMKDAAVAAAEELGRLPVKKWAKELQVGDEENGLRGYFKFLAIKHPKSFAIILSRIMPLHVTRSANKLPKYITEEQMRSELRKAGLPEDLIRFMHPVDVMSVDPDEVGDADDIYPDPELDDDHMLDVPPKETEQ